jgi:hypothetical protein
MTPARPAPNRTRPIYPQVAKGHLGERTELESHFWPPQCPWSRLRSKATQEDDLGANLNLKLHTTA